MYFVFLCLVLMECVTVYFVFLCLVLMECVTVYFVCVILYFVLMESVVCNLYLHVSYYCILRFILFCVPIWYCLD